MRAAQIEGHGGPEAIHVVERATPEPATGEARVRVLAAGVNFIDVYKRKGQYAVALPFALGEEGAGVIEAFGGGASEARLGEGDVLRVGDRVAWSGVAGSYATHVIARPAALVKVPEGVDGTHAAALMLQGMTADYLREIGALGPGRGCVVHAAAGGVGLLLLQMARAAGTSAIVGIASTEAKRALAREAGATEVIDYEGFDDAVKRGTRDERGEGVDVVFDSVGKDTFERSLRSLRPRGLLVLFGQSSGPVPPFDPQTLNHLGSLFLTRPTLRDYVRTRGDLVTRAGRVFAQVASGALAVRVHAALPLERAADAHRMLEARETTGKVVLRME